MIDCRLYVNESDLLTYEQHLHGHINRKLAQFAQEQQTKNQSKCEESEDYTYSGQEEATYDVTCTT